jgi:hypothetical protein
MSTADRHCPSPSAGRRADGPGIARSVALSLADRGADAVALVGSYASGDAGEESDLDLAVIGDGPHYRLEVHDGVLVSIGWASAEEQRRRLYDPRWLGTHVPGWRDAVILLDETGQAAALQEEAGRWSWSIVEQECDRWVAESITGFAEEALKLAAALRTGSLSKAAVQRSVLALRLAAPIAVHRRLLCKSENALWDLVADVLGAEWQRAQASALGMNDDGADARCRSGLRLFELAIDEVRPLLDERQVAVVERALRSPQQPSRIEAP